MRHFPPVRTSPTIAAAIAVALLASRVEAGSVAGDGCEPEWIPTFGTPPGPVGGSVHFVGTFDTGSGPALYVAGEFDGLLGMSAPLIVRFDGTTWSPVGALLGDSVRTIAIFDSGDGPRLHAAGSIVQNGAGQPMHNVARWTGSAWQNLGTGVNGFVSASAVFDDGNGPALYVGGSFSLAGGAPAANVARWDGTTWSALGSGTNQAVEALAVFDDGSGAALYVGGNFQTAGGSAAKYLARWDGTSWSSAGEPSARIHALATFDFGSGLELCAGGQFSTIGGVSAPRVARFDGATWSPIGAGFSGIVRSLRSSGPALYASGEFGSSGPTTLDRVAKWDGSAWAAIGDGLPATGGTVRSITEFQGAIWAGGNFSVYAHSAIADYLASFDGASWSPIDRGVDGDIRASVVHDDGTGPALYVGGMLRSGGGTWLDAVGRWDGTAWSHLGSVKSQAEVHALASWDHGQGPTLYAGGSSTWIGGVSGRGIARWDGNAWNTVGPSATNIASVYALAVHDDGGGERLYAGGTIQRIGGVDAFGIARWDGATWQPVGAGIGTGSSRVNALTVFDDGQGANLYAAGSLPGKVQRWNGASWSALPAAPPDTVRALCVFDDGGGPALYAGSNHVWRWRGNDWTALGSPGSLVVVYALHASTIEGPPRLFAAGQFDAFAGQPLRRIARWDGAEWSGLGTGISSPIPIGVNVRTIATFDDGKGAALFAGGRFESAGGTKDWNLGKWACPTSAFTSIPGCLGNPGTLAATTPSLAIGKPFGLAADSPGADPGWAVVYVGSDGTTLGCGLFLPGLGEVLLGLSPPPVVLDQGPISGGPYTLGFTMPNVTGLVGIELAFQAATIALPTGAIAMTNALRSTLKP